MLVWLVSPCFHGHGDFKDLSVGIVSDVVPRYDTSRLGLACALNGRSGINCTDLSKATIARENRFTIIFHAFLVEEASIRVREFNSLFRIC